MVTLEFNDEEIIALRQLLHRAVLHSGMDVAEACLHFNKKILAASVASVPLTKLNGRARKDVGITSDA